MDTKQSLVLWFLSQIYDLDQPGTYITVNNDLLHSRIVMSHIKMQGTTKCTPLFVFLKSDPKQNARSLLTPVSDPAFHALSHGSLSFALHGSFTG